MLKKFFLFLAILIAVVHPSYAQEVYDDESDDVDSYQTPMEHSPYYYTVDAPDQFAQAGFQYYGWRYWNGHRYFRYRRHHHHWYQMHSNYVHYGAYGQHFAHHRR